MHCFFLHRKVLVEQPNGSNALWAINRSNEIFHGVFPERLGRRTEFFFRIDDRARRHPQA